MDIKKLSPNYDVRILTKEDIQIIYDLESQNEMYFKHCPPFVTEETIQNDLEALPPNKTMDDKYFIGFFQGSCLLAIMDLILEYPNTDTVFMGFFMLDKQIQGKGEGTKMIRSVEEYIKACGYKSIRLGFVEGNPQAEHFWIKNGYERTGVKAVQENYTVIVVQKTL